METGVGSAVKFRTALLALTLGIVALSLAAQKKTAETSGPVVFAEDKGKLTIKLGGQTVGHEEFEIEPSGGQLNRMFGRGTPMFGSAPEVKTAAPEQSDVL